MKISNKIFGFTLIEILVVITIISLLITIASPLYTNHVARAREATLKAILGNMRTAIAQYRVTYNTIPTLTNLSTLGVVLEHEFPSNPFNKLRTVEAATQTDAYATPSVTTNTTGWRYYNGSNGDPPVFYANSNTVLP